MAAMPHKSEIMFDVKKYFEAWAIKNDVQGAVLTKAMAIELLKDFQKDTKPMIRGEFLGELFEAGMVNGFQFDAAVKIAKNC
jgi:hypothetical protein